MRAAGRPRELTLAALPCIAQLWLAPRLPELQGTFDRDVAILTRDEQPDYARELVDLGLYFADAPAGCTAVVLARDDLFRSARRRSRRGCAIRATSPGRRLLHDSVWHEDWPRWLSRHGPAALSPVREAAFSLTASPSTPALAAAGSSSATAPSSARRSPPGASSRRSATGWWAGRAVRLIVPAGGEGARIAPVIRWLSGEVRASQTARSYARLIE